MRRPLHVLLALALVAACSSDGATESTATSTTETTTTQAEPESDLPWWNDRVFYEIFVRSFKDSNGDGVGDFAGLTASLDYLNDGDPSTTTDLGVTGIWLMPIFPSPSYHGYDVTHYRAINPDYGTMEDFTEFLEAAHERGIAVLIDLVINHTSLEHPWFRAAATGDADYADWYLWSDTDPGTVSPWNGGPVWHYRSGRYYFGLFWSGMPDLNLENPAVTAELQDIAHFWLDKGVDGFRLDAARHLIEDGPVMSGTPETLAWLEGFNDFVDGVAPDALVLGEVWDSTEEVSRYVPEALDLVFEFELAEAGGKAVETQDAAVFEEQLSTVEQSYPDLQYATFLTNHDMNRIMSEVGGDLRIAKLAATWLLTGPGVPFIYYGEEVGLQGVKPDERIRTPMPWTDQAPGVGFTSGTPWEPAYEGFDEFNVADENADSDSLLSHYRALIQDRATSLALRRGDLLDVETSSPTLVAYLRSEGDDHVLVLLNLAPDYATEISLDLDSGPLAGMLGVAPIVGPEASAPTITDTGGFAGYRPLESIPPYGYLALRFTPEPSPEPPVTTTTVAETTTTMAASESDARLVERLVQSFSSEDATVVAELMDPDATVVLGDGSVVPLSFALPPEAGFDARSDWDGDGVVTLGDVILAQNAWGSAIVTDLQAECAPVGGEVVCRVVTTDVFEEAAGLDPVPFTQSFRLVEGRVVEIGEQTAQPPEDYEMRWVQQFVAFEQWLAEEHPDAYQEVFREPCCSGSPDGMLFTRESIEVQRGLIAEWIADR